MKREKLLYLTANFFSLPIVFIFSVWLSGLYVGGDQVYYSTIYKALPDFGFLSGLEYYKSVVSSMEPMHFFFSWVFSRFLEKDYFVAFSNVFLAHAALLLCKKKNVNVAIAVIIVTTNFYFLVMYFAAERLKFGMIFFLYSLCFYEHYKKAAGFAFLAVLSHVQMFVFYAVMVVGYYVNEIYKALVDKRISSNVLAVLILGFGFVFAMHDQLLKKITVYYALRDFSEVLKMLLFFAGSLFYAKQRKAVFFIFLFFILAVFLFGGKRINMVGFFVFLYCSLGFRGGVNLGAFIVLAYFSFASLGFVEDIIQHGNGFYDAQLRK